jgi:hypothetical protein
VRHVVQEQGVSQGVQRAENQWPQDCWHLEGVSKSYQPSCCNQSQVQLAVRSSSSQLFELLKKNLLGNSVRQATDTGH